MITDNNRKATIIAYYFSNFDREAMIHRIENGESLIIEELKEVLNIS